MDNDLLRRTGESLYGSLWQAALARDLGVSDRTVRRWVAGGESPRPGVWLDLLRLAQEHAQALDDVMAELHRRATP